ncbi:MAG: hypothetical protein QF415_17520, partial [Candidatus Undinarchaeales archaeon]|nr:hypothetical protein [Candidatus Undinarchaeales archaeon]
PGGGPPGFGGALLFPRNLSNRPINIPSYILMIQSEYGDVALNKFTHPTAVRKGKHHYYYYKLKELRT